MPEPQKVSFRGQLKGEVGDFIEKVDMACVETTQAVVDLIVELSHYEEEGTALYPKVLVCDSLTATLGLLQGGAPLEIGQGPKNANTAKQALKKCAPLARQGWSIYIERHPNQFKFGVFREPELPTAVDIRVTLVTLPAKSVRALLISQLAERAVELIGPGERHLHVHLSAASTEARPPGASIEVLIAAAIRNAPERVSEPLKSYLSSTIGRSLLHGHGALIAVVPMGRPVPPSLAEDGTTLAQPIEIARLVDDFLNGQSTEAMLALTAYGSLLEGMLGSDGITIVRSDAAIVGYNFFVKRRESENTPESELIGGARRRAFAALCRTVDSGELACAFIRSSNGSSDHYVRGAKHD